MVLGIRALDVVALTTSSGVKPSILCWTIAAARG
uniref:Uncharacterized protein n=1 Tax=Arundo donax TaxID=35708 RepID=A0A0A9G5P0_ARUDO